MKQISFRDLLVDSSLSHIKNEIELLSPTNDHLVNALLETIGFDVKQRVEYEPSNHRDMQGKEAVGFRAIGEYSIDDKYKQFLDVTDRIVVAGMQDISLAKEMARLMGKKQTYTNNEDDWRVHDKAEYYTAEELLELGFSEGDSYSSEEEAAYERQRQDIENQINQLLVVRNIVRGE